jgi:L-ascorbate metabolism protein UlaG (beta-lactamase superfamily)
VFDRDLHFKRPGAFRRQAALLCSAILLLVSPASPLSAPKEDGELFPPPPRDHVTFWGHACCYIDVQGFGIVTDPVFAGRYVFRRRKIPVPPAGSRAGARLILVSHAHMDHLHPGSIEMFPDSATVLCPWTVSEYIEETGRSAVIMGPGDTFEYPHGRVIAVAADHPGKRYALRGGGIADAIGFVITTPFGNIYYSGDTGYFDGMNDIGAAWQPEIAIVNITPHLTGESAVRAVWATRAKRVIPVHFGAYDYVFFGPLESPRGYEEIERLIADQAILLQPGESIPLEGKVGKIPGHKPNPRLE